MHTPRKRFGQNFLVDQNIIADIEGSSDCWSYEGSSFMTAEWARACLGMTRDVAEYPAVEPLERYNAIPRTTRSAILLYRTLGPVESAPLLLSMSQTRNRIEKDISWPNSFFRP